jgi:hypothetical protein
MDFRRFSDLSLAEAEALLQGWVATVPSETARFVDDVRGLGGPTELDLSRDSLVAIWTWMLATRHVPPEPLDLDVIRAADPPWWVDFHPPAACALGVELTRLVTGLQAYMTSMYLRERPRSRWILGWDPKGADYRHVILRVNRGREWPHWIVPITVSNTLQPGGGIKPYAPLPDATSLWRIYDENYKEVQRLGPFDCNTTGRPGTSHEIVIDQEALDPPRIERWIELLGGLSGIAGIDHPEPDLITIRARRISHRAMREAVAATWATSGGEVAPEQPADPPPFEILPGTGWPSHVIMLNEAVAHEEADRIERWIAALGADAGIDEATLEDREVVHVHAPRLSEDEASAIIRGTWDEVR